MKKTLEQNIQSVTKRVQHWEKNHPGGEPQSHEQAFEQIEILSGWGSYPEADEPLDEVPKTNYVPSQGATITLTQDSLRLVAF